MARANPHWRSFEGGQESLVAFVGPHSYISPNWYAQPDDVPTWNYAAVHAYGVPRIIDDPDLLRRHVILLADKYERELDTPWDPANVESQMGSLLNALVGFEIPIGRLEGTFKFNQNRSREDRAGVVSVLERSTDPTIREVATIMHRDLHDLPLLGGVAE
jgi:transcriptional regulator